ncbi:hypothetical protein N9L68_01595 [bacterium]|nr:hypothetical protein [bacterium]
MPWLIRWPAMAVPRFKPETDKKTPYERQTGRSCDKEVILFGERFIYRVPEVARDSHQALEGMGQGSMVVACEEHQRNTCGHEQRGHKSLGYTPPGS